jgi:hypothetical protein
MLLFQASAIRFGAQQPATDREAVFQDELLDKLLGTNLTERLSESTQHPWVERPTFPFMHVIDGLPHDNWRTTRSMLDWSPPVPRDIRGF